jgi:hypothetical protein
MGAKEHGFLKARIFCFAGLKVQLLTQKVLLLYLQTFSAVTGGGHIRPKP